MDFCDHSWKEEVRGGNISEQFCSGKAIECSICKHCSLHCPGHQKIMVECEGEWLSDVDSRIPLGRLGKTGKY